MNLDQAAIIDLVLRVGVSALMGVLGGFGLAFGWRWRRRAYAALEAAREARARADALPYAQDPGRDVHTRLAAAMESEMLAMGGNPKGDPAGRRAAAMAIAAGFLESCRKANLTVAPTTPADIRLEALERAVLDLYAADPALTNQALDRLFALVPIPEQPTALEASAK